jgi:hypothetical protein
MILEKDVLTFVESWTSGLSSIQDAYTHNEDYKKLANDFIKKHYLFDHEPVLFKPTLTKKTIFRNTLESALSYFVGGKYFEDSGFALKAFKSVEIEDINILIEKDLIAVMGIFDFKLESSNELPRVAFTFILKSTKSGLKIKIHHSSLIV